MEFTRGQKRLAALILVAAVLLAATYGLVRPGEAKLGIESIRLGSPSLPPPKVEPLRLLPLSPTDARTLNARIGFVTHKPTPARPFRFAGSADSRARAVDCLAAAAWYEAGDHPDGERPVIQTVLNRARHPAFPASICGVVFQGSERSTGCQFTFTCDGALARQPSAAAWEKARELAEQALDGAVDARVGNATHYHTDWVVPYWGISLDKIAQVGTHIFYRWRGQWGRPQAFRRAASTGGEALIEKLALVSLAHRPSGAQEPVIADLGLGGAVNGSAISLPPPIQLPGVREKSLRGAVVRGQQADLYFIQLAPDVFPGNYATAAVAICKGRAVCTVLGWRDPTKIGINVPLSAVSERDMSFYFHRDAKGAERALWNCAQIERTNRAQCLPSAGLNELTS